ncbi:hypothetical protein CALVIDRAFT_539257 [Calocera viscosa TUFC12733]|uniref:ELYS-like domain-containing protein n=1 Tax=Calocera viscosa (strain TUFC12733) TaxID=1330018 RepID=A0A167K322_CALVF|nr:hypothetical protein CALVIDRAFT_539257 [Calocera viscosa TUFC12733]
MATSPLTLFPTFPYTPALLAHIGSTRARTPTLLVDHLLALAGITLLYPPRDEPALLLLLQAVEDSAFDRLKRDCILFYLLKDLDWDPSATSSSSSSAAAAAVAAGAGKEEDTEMDEDEVEDLVVPTPAEEFAQRRRIPVAYRLSMHALWLLDHGLPSVRPSPSLFLSCSRASANELDSAPSPTSQTPDSNSTPH